MAISPSRLQETCWVDCFTIVDSSIRMASTFLAILTFPSNWPCVTIEAKSPKVHGNSSHARYLDRLCNCCSLSDADDCRDLGIIHQGAISRAAADRVSRC